MAVERKHTNESESGQSVLEFLLMLPMMVGLVVVLVRINTVIQVSIVNQQYARAQAHWLAFSSPIFPQISLRETWLTRQGYNQMIIGVSQNAASSGGADQRYTPKAATHYIARRPNLGSNEAHEEPTERGLVRVRDTVTICTQPNVISSNGSSSPILALTGTGPGAWVATGEYQIGDATRFDYCGGPMRYAGGGS